MPGMPPEKQRGPRLTAETLTRAQSSLAELDWRLLHWLLRYPLQRADDLVVGVAQWASRATVYRHLQELEASGLVESVLPKTPGEGKRLYHLSNFGLHVLARHLGIPARDLARAWRADEAGLLRRLARLPTLLLLQEVVNGLVMGVAETMTRQGRRPQLVRWTWQRDVVHRFQYREQAMCLFVDAAMALCIRTQQPGGALQDQWYGLYLLCTELSDERLMRLRLERLLRWRESPERWPVYQHMPTVLILATSMRQREHWQHAVESAALSLRLEPLGGALAALPWSGRARLNPWLLNWHMLASAESCHLQELLKPLPLVALPSSLTLKGADAYAGHPHTMGAGGVEPSLTGFPARQSRIIVGDLAGRAASLPAGGPEEQELIALLGLRLSPALWSTLHLLLDHPLLSDRELAASLALERKSVRAYLYTLHRLGCLERVPTEVGMRWQLSARGLHLISATNHFHIRNLVVISDDGAAGGAALMKQRGVDWLAQHIQHTAGVYGFFAALAEAAQRIPEQALCSWETGAVCERRYRLGEQWYNLRPDALAAYRVGQQQYRFWLEWDRGTMNARDLATKFASYAQYIASRQWAGEFSHLPMLLCVAPDIAQERRVHRVAEAGLAGTTGLQVWTTTEGLLNAYGPLAPIWLRGTQLGDQPGSPQGSLRRSWFDAVSGKQDV